LRRGFELPALMFTEDEAGQKRVPWAWVCSLALAISQAQPARVQIARHGLKAPRARSESFPNAAEIGRKIKFLTVNAGFFGPPETSCRRDIACLNQLI